MSRFHPLVTPNPKERMMVMWTDGKPTTVIKTKAEDSDDIPTLPFQYKIPLSKYNTLANVANRKRHKHHVGQRRSPQIVTIQQLPPEDGVPSTDTTSPSHSGNGHGSGSHGYGPGNHGPSTVSDSRSLSHAGDSPHRNDAHQNGHSGSGPHLGQNTVHQGQSAVHQGQSPVHQGQSPVHQGQSAAPDKQSFINNGRAAAIEKDIYDRLEKEYNALKSKEQEEQVELRRLRTENRLLRQRIDNLEKELGTLADRLIQDQVKYAQQAEEIFILRRDLAVTRQRSHDTTQKLDQVTNELEEIKDRSDSQSSASDPDDLRTKDERIEQLESQLCDTRRQLSDSQSAINQLKNKIKDLENQNEQLTTEPSIEIQHLQEELIASKLREAEANLSLKELQQKVHDLDKHWQRYMERQQMSNVKMTKEKSHQMSDDLMAVRLKEAETVAELQETKLKLMELETQNHICQRQIKRQEDDVVRLESEAETAASHDKQIQHHTKELQHKLTDVGAKQKEDRMMSQIKDAEHAQAIAEMRNRIAELEIENQELVTEGQLQERGDRDDLENKISELQEEILQLKMARRLQSLSSLALNNINLDSESDYDADEAEAGRLRLGDLSGADVPALRPPRPTLSGLDSSDTESLTEDSDTKHKIHRKKKKVPTATLR